MAKKIFNCLFAALMLFTLLQPLSVDAKSNDWKPLFNVVFNGKEITKEGSFTVDKDGYYLLRLDATLNVDSKTKEKISGGGMTVGINIFDSEKKTIFDEKWYGDKMLEAEIAFGNYFKSSSSCSFLISDDAFFSEHYCHALKKGRYVFSSDIFLRYLPKGASFDGTMDLTLSIKNIADYSKSDNTSFEKAQVIETNKTARSYLFKEDDEGYFEFINPVAGEVKFEAFAISAPKGFTLPPSFIFTLFDSNRNPIANNELRYANLWKGDNEFLDPDEGPLPDMYFEPLALNLSAGRYYMKLVPKRQQYSYSDTRTHDFEYFLKVSVTSLHNAFAEVEGKKYWYEDGIRQGVYGDLKNVRDIQFGESERGREIYDPDTKAWYWLDAVYNGAAAYGKEVWMPYVYQDEKAWSDNEIRDNANRADEGMKDYVYQCMKRNAGKWVRYDGEGKMLKGWVVIQGVLAKVYPDQKGNTYYYDHFTGIMAKGTLTIEGKTYHFDELTGAMQ